MVVDNDPRCKKNGRCVITVLTRRRCQKCRYNRCQLAGMTPDAVLNEDQKRIRFRKVNQKRQMLTSQRQRGRNSSTRVTERVVVEDVRVVNVDDDEDHDDDDDDGDAVDVNVVENDDEELSHTVVDREEQPVPETFVPINQEIIQVECHSEDEEMVSIPDNENEIIGKCSIENEESLSEVQTFIDYSSDKLMTGINSVVQSYKVCILIPTRSPF